MGNIEQNSVCAVIPAAGRSSRMRTYKPLLKFNDSQTFIEKIVYEFQTFGCKKIIVVVNKNFYEEVNHLFLKSESIVKVIINDNLDLERFYSIKQGLNQVSESDYCFIHNADNPFLNQDILELIFSRKKSDGYTYPDFKDRGGHPIIISKPVIDYITNVAGNNANFKDIIHRFPAIKVDVVSENILFNINTIEEYQQFFEDINSK